MVKVIFCLPGQHFSCFFLSRFTNLLYDLPTFGVKGKVNFALDSNIYNTRNICLEGNNKKGKSQKPFQGKIEYDYIMWIDGDSIFTPGQFKSLLDRMEENKNIRILSGLCEKEGKDSMNYQLLKQSRNSGLFTSSFSCFAFTLVRAGVFEKLSYPWFEPLSVERFSSENFFCQKAQKAGFTMWTDPTVQINFEKMVILR